VKVRTAIRRPPSMYSARSMTAPLWWKIGCQAAPPLPANITTLKGMTGSSPSEPLGKSSRTSIQIISSPRDSRLILPYGPARLTAPVPICQIRLSYSAMPSVPQRTGAKATIPALKAVIVGRDPA